MKEQDILLFIVLPSLVVTAWILYRVNPLFDSANSAVNDIGNAANTFGSQAETSGNALTNLFNNTSDSLSGTFSRFDADMQSLSDIAGEKINNFSIGGGTGLLSGITGQ
jgi:hypothetical protein